MKKLLAILAALAMLLTVTFTAAAEDAGEKAIFAEWNSEAPALKTLIEYVEAVTDENNPDFIPVPDRIAVFDMDGTLCAELNPTYLEYYMLAWRILRDPSYQPDAEMLEFGRMLRDHALDKSFPDHMDMLHATHAAKAYAGMTLTQFSDFVTNCLVREADGFEGMTYANTFYLPMIEVVEYLQDNDFTVYVVSGSDRYLCRTYLEGVLDIPYSQIIGMDVKIEASNQQGTDGLDYVYSKDDTLVRTDVLKVKNLKMNKVSAIIEDIGRQPVLSFGNSSGDCSMHNYTMFNNRYRSAAFMLIADNEELDYGNAEKVQPLKEKWIESGYNVISMRDDFRTIYGDEVKKTGTFHWLEDLAEERIPADAVPETPAETPAEPPAETPAEIPAAEPAGDSAETQTVQYVMYVGTNDKDTNKPVFTQAEAMEKLKEVLIRHFGGYTIQEANGGWIDSGTEYQEYTLVVYLSDTTLDKVHAAAGELATLFRQSSILIQQNPTTTEFYSPAR